MAITPSKRRQSDIAYERLKELIIHTELPPGELIDENALGDRLGLGRTPIREAVQRLAQENLIDVIPRRGAFVADITPTDLASVFELRRYLEGLAAELAADRATERGIEKLKEVVEKAADGMDSDDLYWNIEMDRQIHDLVAELAANGYLLQTLEWLYNLAIRLLYLSKVRLTMVREEMPEYLALLDAIENHDANAARNAMLAHLGEGPHLDVVA